jgi:hypothetical protein
MPDEVYTPVMADIESRMGIDPIHILHATRAAKVAQVADLRARFGVGGTYNDLRKIELAQIAALLRAQALRDGVKLTESAIDESAHADARYMQFVADATSARAKWAILEDEIQAVDELINRGQACARFVSMERTQ